MRFLDLGSGVNKPALHVAATFPVKSAIGIECMQQRVSLAAKVHQVLLEDKSSESKAHAMAPCNVLTVDAMQLTNIKDLGINVIYAFNSAFDPELMYKIAEIWNLSDVEVLIIFTNIDELIKFGFLGLIWKGSLKLQMTHSKEGKTVHFYTREKRSVLTDVAIVPSNPMVAASATTRSHLKRKLGCSTLIQDDEELVCQHIVPKIAATSAGVVGSKAVTTQPSIAACDQCPEAAMLRAMELCEDAGSRKELIAYLESTFEEGLKTSEQVLLPDGHVVKKGIRVKHSPEYYSP
jgi:hypothetical protein